MVFGVLYMTTGNVFKHPVIYMLVISLRCIHAFSTKYISHHCIFGHLLTSSIHSNIVGYTDLVAG